MIDDPVTHLSRSRPVGSGASSGACPVVGRDGRVAGDRYGGTTTGDSGTPAVSTAGRRVHWWVNDTTAGSGGPVTVASRSKCTQGARTAEVVYDELTSAYD
ncbi:hypothetical protein [Haloarcula sp. JP-L23]|uniref:hypothetical protein n=1 Tax=Haloarcula sp. JP-L23 TaxID=2716717 RepID=UPI00140F1ABD|nr:hypothetical protein G9465_09440 [Haloarcula sp. JP-L23]